MKRLIGLVWMLCVFACSAPEPVGVGADALQPAAGISLRWVNGVWSEDVSPFVDAEQPTALHVVAGPRRYLDELYIVSSLPTTEVDGMVPVVEGGDLSVLDWSGLEQVGDDWRLEPSGTTWQHQAYYRGAHWMEHASKMKLRVRNAGGTVLSSATMRLGKDDDWNDSDTFFERRLVGRVLSSGCVAEGDCSNPEAQHRAEARVQLHSALHEERVELDCDAARIDLTWDAAPGKTWSVDVVQEPASDTGYGFGLTLEEVDPPARGFYLPGEVVAVRRVFTDGAGNDLFPGGTMPSYADILHRRPAAKGLRYLTFVSAPQLYWAQKDPQAAQETFLAGPVHLMDQVAVTPITPASLGLAEIPAATVALDGYSSVIQETPITTIMFGCLLFAFGCEFPLDPVFSFTVPADAQPGTWVTGTKARREWSGEPVQRMASIHVQVGQLAPTTFAPFPVPGLSPCNDCHIGATKLKHVAHGHPTLNRVGAECLACHTDGYYFEPDAGVVTRLQYLHAQSDRLVPP